jgi:hypothetical protein
MKTFVRSVVITALAVFAVTSSFPVKAAKGRAFGRRAVPTRPFDLLTYRQPASTAWRTPPVN